MKRFLPYYQKYQASLYRSAKLYQNQNQNYDYDAYYKKAQQLRRLIANDFNKATQNDVISEYLPA